MVRFEGKIGFAQPVKLTSVKKDLKCRLEKRKIRIGLKQDEKDPAVIAISTDPLKRKLKGRILTFTLPGPYTVDRGEWKKEILLPAANVFKVIAHMDMSDPEARQSVYGFRFSDPVKTGTDLSGYINITPRTDYKISVSGKYLKIHGRFLPGDTYAITIAEGLPCALGTKLRSEYTTEFSFTNIKPQLAWLSEGVYLPSTNDFKLQFKSVNVSRVYLKVTEIYPNNLGFFVQNNVLRELRSKSYYYTPSYSDLNRVGKEVYKDTISLSSEMNRWLKTELNLASVVKGKRNTAFIITMRFGQKELTGRCINDRNDLRDGDL
jgi:hypothetical protein